MGNVVKEQGDSKCNHSWVTREKKHVQVLTRFCQNCNRVEHLSDNLSENSIKEIKGE